MSPPPPSPAAAGDPGDVVVTGGTGALGSAVVAAFLAAGRRVVVPWIVAAEADRLRRSVADDAPLQLVEADVAEEAGARTVAAASPSASVLVNGVGGFAGGPPVADTELDDWDRMYRMNLRTAVAMSRSLVPGMRLRGRGVIVNVTSQAARARPAGLAAYAASKAGITVLTETLQKEVAEAGLRVVAVAPGTIDTPANRAAMPDADPSTWTDPAAIARVILWLASDAAAPSGGAIIPV